MSADVISLLVAWQLAVTLHSHRAGMEMARMVLSYLSQLLLEDNTFIMMSLHYNLGVLSLEGTGVYQAASAALILTTLFNSCTPPSETLNQ